MIFKKINAEKQNINLNNLKTKSEKFRNLVFIFFISLLFNLNFWAVSVLRVEAANEIYCHFNGTSLCRSLDNTYIFFDSGSRSTCTTGLGADQTDNSTPVVSFCENGPVQCASGRCPTTNGASDGDPCKVRWLSGSTVNSASGIWDNSRKSCVECTSGGLGKVWGDGSALFTSPSEVCKEICGGPAARDGLSSCTVSCTNTNPTVSIIGSASKTAPAGDTATYSISVTNNDSFITCSPTDFTLAYSGCAGWTCSLNVASTGNISGGTSSIPGSITLSVISPVGTPPGTSKNIVVTASGNDKSGEVTATYIVAAADALIVTPSITSIAADEVQGNIIFTVADGSGALIPGANVTLSGGYSSSCLTGTGAGGGGPLGKCVISGIVSSGANVSVSATATGYTTGTNIITVTGVGPGPCLGFGAVCTTDAECCSNDCIPGAPSRCSGVLPGGESGALCTDGVDNDLNGDIDCADVGCAANPVCAGGGGGGGGSSECDNTIWFFCNPLRGTIEDIFQAGETLIGYILGLIGSVALLLIIIAGVMYMTSMGNEERITNSKRIITGAVIGLAIALLSYSLLQLVLSIL